MRYRKAQSIISWVLVIGTVATVVLYTSSIFRRMLIKKVKQVNNLALWTKDGPTQWTENVFNENGSVIGNVTHQGIGLQYKDDDTKAKDVTDTVSTLISHEHKGVISTYAQDSQGNTIPTQQKTKRNLTQYSVGDGFEDWLP